MAESLASYTQVGCAFLAMGILFILQTLVADVAGIKGGHVPGTPVGGGHDDFLFRAARAHANTNENFGAFIVLALSAVALAASPVWTNRLVWAFVAARAAHMLAYYADLRIIRSAAFGVGLVALVGLAIVSAAAYL